MRKFTVLLFSIGAVLLFITGQILKADDDNSNFFSEIPPRASVFGKYSGLKQRFHCTKALYKMTFRNNLRNFHDIGLNKKTEDWCGTTLQPGYIVYYGGLWYVWEKQEKKDPSDEILATMNGTYTGLIKKKNCRNSMRTKGKFIEFGHITSPMCDSPKKSDTGYFVYVKPYVYIYEKKIIPRQYMPADVDVGGKYSDLINVVRCDLQGEQKYDESKMKDSGVVLEFDDEYQRNRLWPDMCGESLGQGHYVYKYPNWYSWKNSSAESEE
ncbi:MAG: hypothetical protein H7A24_11195 [Leptospiraceae bacterium]|nr:hypothetical protein [Leptospiraceae bacterium]